MMKSAQNVIVIGDTHVSKFEELPKQMFNAIMGADWVIHVGDFESVELVHSLKKLKEKKFKGVYGNADPLSVRKELPEKNIFKINNRTIGIIHPASGGPSRYTRTKVFSSFKDKNIDILIFGHTHEALVEQKGELLILNPGEGYINQTSFGPNPSFIILKINEELKVKIVRIKLDK